MDLMAGTDLKQIPKSVCNRNQAHKYLQRHLISVTDSDHKYILGKIKPSYSIECSRDISVR